MSRRGYGRENEVDRLLRGHLREPSRADHEGEVSEDAFGCDGEATCTADRHTPWCRTLGDPQELRRR